MLRGAARWPLVLSQGSVSLVPRERLRSKGFELIKILGSENPADVMAKTVDAPLLNKHLAKLHLHDEDGRPDTAASMS